MTKFPTITFSAAETEALRALRDIPLQATSQDIWSQKYCLRDENSTALDADVEATKARTARALAQVEKTNRAMWERKFFRSMMEDGSTPAGRIMSNAGAEAYKPAVSLINCTVSDTIPDSMDGILMKLHEAGMTLKAGCGIGYEFSTIRPDGAYVFGAGATTSGPLSFMDIYDKMCFTVSSAGGRRGAQMATFDVSHPDAMKFISAKREDGRFRQFNCSLLITDAFIEAVRNDAMWQPMWNGKPFGEAFRALDMWEKIMDSNYNFAEPGFLLVDRINQYNNLWFCENLRATNPCGEQPLPPYGSCLLGSQNLTRFVRNPFTKTASFDFDRYYEATRLFTRMLDNVVEMNGLPLSQQRHEIITKRRHGMGYLGLGSTMALLGMSYGSEESVAFTEEVTRNLAMAGFEEGAALAKEKGEAPVLAERYSSSQVREYARGRNSNFTGKKTHYSGRDLFLQSHYFDAWRDHSDGARILKLLKKHGSRFSHHSSIAPTGTISLSFGNNASNGIEPSFSHFYTRNRIVEGKNAKEAVDVYSFEYLAYKTLVDSECEPTVLDVKKLTDEQLDYMAHDGDVMALCKELHVMPVNFMTTDSLTPRQHVDIQAAAQKWIDSSISKTINVPTDISKQEFKDTYLYAHEKGLKGCTTFRFNPEAFQGVLVKKDDLAATTYAFTLEDGSTVEFAGDAMVEYDGQVQTAANLYDAIKEGYFGKF